MAYLKAGALGWLVQLRQTHFETKLLMKLFFTGPEFILNGASRPEIPFLVDGEMEMVSAPNQYLRYIATVKGRTAWSWAYLALPKP